MNISLMAAKNTNLYDANIKIRLQGESLATGKGFPPASILIKSVQMNISVSFNESILKQFNPTILARCGIVEIVTSNLTNHFTI